MRRTHLGTAGAVHVSILTFLLIGLYSSLSFAEKTVVVLPFSGKGGDQAHDLISRALSKKYTLVPASRLKQACDKMGVKAASGADLASCASAVNASAVVGGAVKQNKLQLAVYSGMTGEALARDSVRWSRTPKKAHLREALSVVLDGLNKAPDIVLPPPAKAGAGAGAAGAAAGAGAAASTPGELTFTPEKITSSAPLGTPTTSDEENPFTGPAPTDQAPMAAEPEDQGIQNPFPPRIAGYIGLGIWTRSFELDNPVAAPGVVHPSYDSGAAFALRASGEARPGAFFVDNFLANFYARVRFMMTVGLSSNVSVTSAGPPPTTTTESLSTSMMEVLLDAGYDWNILGKLLSPHIRGGVGFGLNTFSVDWGSIAQALPDTSYSFVLLNIGAGYPFALVLNDALLIGAHAHFDYRLGLSAGEVQEAAWYGPGSLSGLAFGGGFDVRYLAFVFALDYTYTSYSLSFDSATTGQTRTADGASDTQHAVMLSLGYSY